MESQTTIQELKELMRELALSQKETDEKFKETDKKFKETAERFKETDTKFKETDRYIRRVQGQFDTQWGRLMESLVDGDIIRILTEKGIEVHNTSTRRKGRKDGEQFEFDIIAHNGNEIVVIEVKTILRVRDVNKHIERLKKVKLWLSEYQHHRILGSVAYLQADEESEIFAERKGLFVIRATGDSAAIINQVDFVPRAF